MAWESPGYHVLSELNSYGASLPGWTQLDYENNASYDTGRIALQQSQGQQFYVIRDFDDDDNEFVYIQLLGNDYSTYGISGPTSSLIAGEPVTGTYVARPWIENGEVIGRDNTSVLYFAAGDEYLIWANLIGGSFYAKPRLSALGGFGYLQEIGTTVYSFAGGLPYNPNYEKPFQFSDHFFTPDGTVLVRTGAGSCVIMQVHSYEDMESADPHSNDTFQFEALKLLCKNEELIGGFIPELYWVGNHKVTIEATDGACFTTDVFGRFFKDGEDESRLIFMQNAVAL